NARARAGRRAAPARARPSMVTGAVATALLAAAIGLATPGEARADAKLIDLHASALAGGIAGFGLDDKTPDFFSHAAGPGFGAQVGLRLLIVDLTIRFVQMVGTDGREGTLSTVMLGPLLEIPVVGGGTDTHGNPRPPKVVVRPGV